MSRLYVLFLIGVCGLCMLGGAAPLSAQGDGTPITADNASQLTQLMQIDTGGDNVYSVAWYHDGTYLFAGREGGMSVLEAATGEEVWVKTSGPGFDTLSVVLSPDGTRVARADSDGTLSYISIWDLTTDTSTLIEYSYVLSQAGINHAAAQSVAWSPDGTKLASVGAKAVQTWDAASGSQLLTTQGGSESVNSVAWSPDGYYLAAGGRNGVLVWDAFSGGLVFDFEGHGAEVTSVAWSPNGQRIASASDDATVRIWDLASGSQYAVLQGHGDYVKSVAWSPDGTLIASGSSDRTVWVWDAATGTPLAVLNHNRGVSSVAWSPDGTRLASGTSDGLVQVWGVGSGSALPPVVSNPDSDGDGVADANDPCPYEYGTDNGCPVPPASNGTGQGSTNAQRFVGRWAWLNYSSQTWYTYQFFEDGQLEITNPADPNYYTVGTYEVVDDWTVALIYTESSDYLSSPGYRNEFQYTLTEQEVEYQGVRAVREVLIIQPPDLAYMAQTLIRIDAVEPSLDSDGDGVVDAYDLCPYEYGIDNGCPVPPASNTISSFTEEFNDPYAFYQTSDNVYIADGKVYWNVSRSEVEQYVYRDIPAFSGDVRLTVTGEVDSWDNNCGVYAGIGNVPWEGTAIQFGFTGGGCSGDYAGYPPGPFVGAMGVTNWDFGENGTCGYWGNWQRIGSGTPYTATLTIQSGLATLSVPGSIIGSYASGTPTYTGTYDTLYVGLTGDGDWPSCSGTIDSIIVEPLGSPTAAQGSVPIYVGYMGAGSMEYGIGTTPDFYLTCDELQAQFSVGSVYSPLAIFLGDQYQPDPASTYGVVDTDSDPWEVMVFKIADVVNTCPALSYVTQTLSSSSGGSSYSTGGGEIAFVSDRDGNNEIYVMNTDGSNVRRLTYNGVNDSSPAWSPDGSQIAFLSDQAIYVMNADGSNLRYLTGWPCSASFPSDIDIAWSPDGRYVTFSACREIPGDIFAYTTIYEVDVASGSIWNLTGAGSNNSGAAWSPDGAWIAFVSDRADQPNPQHADIYLMDVYAFDAQRLTYLDTWVSRLNWSPDGSQIVFQGYPPDSSWYQIYAVNADGSNMRRLTYVDTHAENPSWSPDGYSIAFDSYDYGDAEIYVMDTNGGNIQKLTDNSANDKDPDWRS